MTPLRARRQGNSHECHLPLLFLLLVFLLQSQGITCLSFNETHINFKLDTFFRTQSPCHIVDGIRLAFFNVFKGSIAGVLSLIVQPVYGAKVYGVLGFMGGVVGGVASAMALPLAGAWIGMTQIMEGLGNTPGALKYRREGMVWSEGGGVWEEFILDDEYKRLTDMKSDHSKDNLLEFNPNRSVKNNYYYDLLEVSPNAPLKKIKKAYHQKARLVHPDKLPDDPLANKKFLALSEAYQTLSNPSDRRNYDMNGKLGETSNGNAASEQKMDPIVFFKVFFGTFAVKNYVGDLWLASVSKGITVTNTDVKTNVRSVMLNQKIRELNGAKFLRERIQSFWDLPIKKFQADCRDEARQIERGVYGEMFLLTIGQAMTLQSREFLNYMNNSDLGISGYKIYADKRIKGIGRNIGIVKRIARTIWSSGKALYKINSNKDQDKNEQTVTEIAQILMDQSLAEFLELAWSINMRDIALTTLKSCYALFSDANVPIDVRKRRAEAVFILGTEFYNVGTLAQLQQQSRGETERILNDVDYVKRRAEVALSKAMMQGDGEEEDDYGDIEQLIQSMRRSSF